MRDVTPTGGPAAGGIEDVLARVRAARGFDAAGYCPSVLETRVRSRLAAAGAADYGDYLRLLAAAPAELDLLVEALTLKVSSFFRDPLAFEYLAEALLPAILAEKAAAGDRSLRVWSAGCATGEEPYSVAILLHDLARRAPPALEMALFATDLDETALARAREALYPAASLANVRRGLLESSFIQQGEAYRLLPAIARLVRFSIHDMRDRRTAAPADSVFGSFDVILCRNLLIYFETEYQAIICEKLWRSLVVGGYLLLGQTETLAAPWQGRFRQVTDCCRLYRKQVNSGPWP